MDKTKNQHYVPRMYIKRFGYGTEDNPRILVLKKQEGIILHNQNPENFASKRFFYDTTEDVMEDVLKWDIEAFPSIKESKFYHDEQLAEHTLSRMEGAYKELLDNLGLSEDKKRKTIEENCVPGIIIQLEKILSLGPVLQTMNMLVEN